MCTVAKSSNVTIRWAVSVWTTMCAHCVVAVSWKYAVFKKKQKKFHGLFFSL